MKMKRSQFKQLIKECLVELLKEDKLLEYALKGATNTITENKSRESEILIPNDENSLKKRNAIVQKNLLSRSNKMNLKENVDDEQVDNFKPTKMSKNTNERTQGIRHPSDYITMAISSHSQRILKPELDTPIGKQAQVSRPRQVQQQIQEENINPFHVMDSISPETLREMYTDTANGTLKEQAAYGHTSPGHHQSGLGNMAFAGPGDIYEQTVAQSDPLDLFGPAAQSWGELAFK